MSESEAAVMGVMFSHGNDSDSVATFWLGGSMTCISFGTGGMRLF